LRFFDDLSQLFALMPLSQQHRLQRLGIIREVIARHPQIRSYSPRIYDDLEAPDSLRRSAANSYPACVGVTVSRASWTSRQSRPSSSADNCAADRRITPSSIFGPAEDAFLEPFGEQAQTRSIPKDQLDPISSLGTEHINST